MNIKDRIEQAVQNPRNSESVRELLRDVLADRERLAQYARRYKFLRDDAMNGTRHDPAVLKDGSTDCCEFMFGDELDDAIDAAIAQQDKKE